MAKKSISLIVLFTLVFSVFSGIVLAETPDTVAAIKEYNGGTHTLAEDVTANGCDGAVWAHSGANLTITDGNIHALDCKGEKCEGKWLGYSMAVNADGKNTVVTISGGSFTNNPDPNDPTHVDLIYAANGAEILITGGTFNCATPNWTLNCKDGSTSTITVKGGRFYKFNPALANYDPSYGQPNSPTGVTPKANAPEIIVPEGYTVIQDGDWYEVKKLNAPKVCDGTTETINSDITANGCDGAIYAKNNANITIDGGNIHGQLCLQEHKPGKNCGYSMAVWSTSDSTVTINGGNFTQDWDYHVDPKHDDLIYASEGGKIIINGGTFKSTTPDWTLNCKDRSTSTITVQGGRFYKFNPAVANTEHGSGVGVAPAGKTEIIVPADYKVVQDGDWFEVVCAHLECEEHAGKDATYAEEGMEAYWTCKLCSKMFADKEATVEITDKNSLVLPKLAEVVAGNATVTEVAFDEAVIEAEKIGSSTVVIPVFETKEKVTSVIVPVSSLEDVASENKELAILTSEAEITIDAKAVEEISKQAKGASDVRIEVAKVGDSVLNDSQKAAIKDKEVAAVISAQILADGKVISDFGGGKVKVEIPFTPAEDAKGEEYVVIYIADDGKITEIPTKYKDGIITVELEHFSEYAIVKNVEVKEDSNTGSNDGASAPAETAPSDTTTNSNIVKTGDNIVLYISILVISVLGATIIVAKKFNIKK